MKMSHEIMDPYFCGGNTLGYLQRTDLWQKSPHQLQRKCHYLLLQNININSMSTKKLTLHYETILYRG
jgi:hypothetical protein